MRRRRGAALLAAVLVLAACSDTVTVGGGTSTTTASTSTSVPATQPGTVPGTSTSVTQSSSPDTGATTTTTGPTTDPDGIGDVLFPALGNPGVDVEHYDIALAYDHTKNALAGTVTMDVRMTSARREFTLDSSGPHVTAVTIDGTPVAFATKDPELHITPATPLAAGTQIKLAVTYDVVPKQVTSGAGLPSGWFQTAGGSYVLDEPDGARTWLPSDDHPSDKATYRFTLNVAKGVTAVANGEMVDHTSTATGEQWTWVQDQPMATYLIQVLTGDYELVDGTGPNGLPLVSAVLRTDRPKMQPYIDNIGEQIAFFETVFGAFPLHEYGIAMSDSFGGLAMETQGRSLFSRDDFTSGKLGFSEQVLLAHELAHQWFGDAVTLADWSDIWLNESFATYGQWLWLDHIGGTSVDDSARGALASRPPGSSAHPSAGDMFGFNSYDGGAVVLHALRLTIGDDKFFQLLQTWVAQNNGTSCTTAQFIALANKVAGQDLTQFFAEWLFADRPPAAFPEPPVG